jgi:hypothetical protein
MLSSTRCLFAPITGGGIGDFRGLTERLNYLQDLGITAIWVLPFFPSPLRDDGYDVADYDSVNPIYGSLEDFQEFIAEAHRREIYVIIELVIKGLNRYADFFTYWISAAFWQAYRARAKPSLLPATTEETRILLTAFSIEQAFIALKGPWHPAMESNNTGAMAKLSAVLDRLLSYGHTAS